MYSVAEYGSMIADRVRMAAYVEALRRTIKPGCVVVDLGAGTGIFSLWAARFGAGRVYAIESNPAAYLLKEHAKRNGFADTIRVIPKASTKVELPELADVLVSDLRGASPLYARHIDVIKDARQRFLAPRGVQVPMRDELHVSMVEGQTLLDHILRGTHGADQPFDLSASRESVLESDHPLPRSLSNLSFVGDSACWAALDYASPTLSADCSGEVTLHADRRVMAHGLVLSFRACLLGDSSAGPPIWFDSGRGGTTAYSPIFLPWPSPLALDAGQAVRVALRASWTPIGYIYSWQTDGGGVTFRQSNFHAFGPPPGVVDT